MPDGDRAHITDFRRLNRDEMDVIMTKIGEKWPWPIAAGARPARWAAYLPGRRSVN
jgi:hypothetical protein